MDNILLDCDGVIADFTTEALKVINRKLGLKGKQRFNISHITQWDICDSVGHPELWPDVMKASSKKGFCLKIKAYPGSEAGVKLLQQHGTVFIVTSPLSAPLWMSERTEWVKKNFGIEKSHVIHTEAKFLVQGTALIDDKFENIQSWVIANPKGLGLLWDMPYNRQNTWITPQIKRVMSFAEAAETIKSWKECQGHHVQQVY